MPETLQHAGLSSGAVDDLHCVHAVRRTSALFAQSSRAPGKGRRGEIYQRVAAARIVLGVDERWVGLAVMRPDLVFARMTARAAQWDTAPGGAQIGGRVLDAALAGGMPRKLWLAGRMRYCLDTSVTLELERLLMVKLTLIALEEGYKRPPGMKPGEPWLRKLSSLAILEEMTPAGCPATLANGTRVLLPWHQKTRALVVDVPLRSWYRHWSRPYGAIVSVLTGWHESAYAYIRKQSES